MKDHEMGYALWRPDAPVLGFTAGADTGIAQVEANTYAFAKEGKEIWRGSHEQLVAVIEAGVRAMSKTGGKLTPDGYRVIFGNYFPREVLATFRTKEEAKQYMDREEADDMEELEAFYFDTPAELAADEKDD